MVTDCVLGTVHLTAGDVTSGMLADGRLLPISSYSALFSLYGTEFGGDGQTTFAVPDLAAVAPDGTSYFICDQGLYPSW